MKRLPLLFAMMLLSLAATAQSIVLRPRTERAHVLTPAVQKAPARAAEVRDDHGLIISPAEGEEKVFNRSGGLIIPVGFGWTEGYQDGQTRFVFCEDGTVYMNHPLYNALERCGFGITDTWIKGTRADGLITFPSQPITWSNASRTTVSISMGYFGSWDAGAPYAKPDRECPIVFKETAGGKVLTLQNSDHEHVLTAFYDNNDAGTAYWDYDTAFTLDTTNDHDPAVQLPAGLDVKHYALTANDDQLGSMSYHAMLAFDGNDAYLGNFAWYAHELWIKGTRDTATGNLSFPAEQFLQNYNNEDLYFYALPKGTSEADLYTLNFTYDAVNDTYKADRDILISRETISMPISRAERLEDVVLKAYPLADDVVYTRPEGELSTYNRYGWTFVPITAEDGTVISYVWQKQEEYGAIKASFITAPDGHTVYMKEPIAGFPSDAWIRGTIEADGTYHFPFGQWLQKEDYYGSFLTGAVKLVKVDGGQTYEFTPDVHEIVYTVDEDGWLYQSPLAADDVEGQDPPQYLYAVIDNDFAWAFYGDFGTVLEPTENPDPSEDLDTPVAGEVKNQYGIIVTPGYGTEKTYSRSGDNYSADGSSVVSGKQDGVVHIMECDDNVVYMQHPVSTYSSAYAATAWIRGYRRADGALCFQPNQPVNYHDYYEASLSVCMGTYSDDGSGITADRRSLIVFTESEDGKTLTLQGSNNVAPLGVFYDDDDAWTGCGDVRTILTFQSEGHTEQTVEPNWKTERLNYTFIANDLEEGTKGYNALLAFEGDVVYLANFSFWLDYLHDTEGKYVWIKGRRNSDGSLTFPKEQYLYTYSEMGKDYDLFFYGAVENFVGYSIKDLTFTYNEADGSYVADGDVLINWGRVTTSISRAEQLTQGRLIPDEFEGSRPYIITEQPEGELLTYTRSGVAFSTMMNEVYIEKQDGDELKLVISPDGRNVYMHNPISKTLLDSWVSGTIDDDGNLHIPLFQWIDYNDDFGYGVRTCGCVLVEQGSAVSYYVVPNLTQMTFTLDHATGTYSLDRLDGIDYTSEAPRLIYGAYWTNDNSWTGFGDFDSVYTPNFDWNAITQVELKPNTETYYDFSGRRVQRPVTGKMYIRNGQKIIK